MHRRTICVLIALTLAVLLGLLLGNLARPENRQMHGTQNVLEFGAPTGISQVGDEFEIEWNNETGGQLIVRNKTGKILWQTIAGEPFIFAAEGKETVSENRGMFNFEDAWRTICTQQTVDMITDTEPDQAMTLSGHLYCNDGSSVLYNIDFHRLPREYPFLAFSIWLQDPETLQQSERFNRLFLTYHADVDEHFFGFGEQFTYFDMKGKRVPIWVSEQGVGRGEQPITFAADLTNGGAGGNAFTTYAPMPFYMTNKMRSFFLVNDSYSVFDLRKKDRVQVEVWSPTVYGSIANGDTPQEITYQFTFIHGIDMLPLPDWIHSGAIIGMQGGTEKVQTVYEELQARHAPIAAFWLQDWVGQRTTSFGKQLWWNWEVDYDRYPGWEDMVKSLENDNIRVMVYVSPYLADIGELKPNMRRNLFQEAKDKGYLVENSNGEAYLVLNTDFFFGMIDLTDPDAVAWYKTVIEEQVVDSGASGWMADFGEGLPYDAFLSSDEPASIIHNVYPVLWATLNREIVEGSDKELVFFNRAAYSSSPEMATLFWEGDQLVSWSEYDGIKSAVTGLNTSGLSGMAFNHSDIGGYTTISSPIRNYHRSRELLYRWMEMNAFTLIFRTHEGNQPDNNVQFYSDDETLDTFAYWAKVYAALFDYRKQLITEAVQTGFPVARHPFIHYPDDPQTWKITYQEFMLGTDFLIAPVTDEGTTEVTAYLPDGKWIHLWSGETHAGGQYVTVPAPIGQPGVFYVKGSKWGEELASRLAAEGLMP